jgi:hypothetical protein
MNSPTKVLLVHVEGMLQDERGTFLNEDWITKIKMHGTNKNGAFVLSIGHTSKLLIFWQQIVLPRYFWYMLKGCCRVKEILSKMKIKSQK